MENQKDPQLTRDEELNAENNLLKLKLGMEHGMQAISDTHNLSPGVENQWLKQVYAFEQQYKDAKRIKLYDYLGQPEFMKWDSLTPEKTSEELKRIRSIFAANNVLVDCICTYDDAVIYKFITEELFMHEMDDMRVPGMIYHFTYEEFHPNHDYDLRLQATDFIRTIFEREWNEKFDQFALAEKVTFSGKCYSRADISAIITAFQEAHNSSDIVSLDITEVVVNAEVSMAGVRALLSASAKQQGDHIVYDGDCSFHFVRDDGYWYIDAFHIPGMV